uniref:Putative reverse transcriptase domain-containing protein n=1 Tax=Tanacetum cinerariifolium TaxID=118510 RepID=A0A699H4T5_TANCI|nr:putative reverse transcriptase domain-containing protein [Tanacetum cinerariifolium]
MSYRLKLSLIGLTNPYVIRLYTYNTRIHGIENITVPLINTNEEDKVSWISHNGEKQKFSMSIVYRDLKNDNGLVIRPGKANVVADALSRKKRVKPRCVRAMAMVIQSEIRGMMLASQSEAPSGLSQQPEIPEWKWNKITMDFITKLPKMKSGHDTIWDVHLPLAEFSYNNSYHSTIRCAPFEALYGRKCRSPVLWAEIGESSLIGPELVSPWKGVIRFRKKGKLAPRYVGPFEILERIGPVSYRLRLPEELSSVHDTFYVSNLKKCLTDANLHVPLGEIKIDKTLCYVEEPVEIMVCEVRSLKRNKISFMKVYWNSKRGPEFTWEREDYMKYKYPQLFIDRAVEPAS